MFWMYIHTKFHTPSSCSLSVNSHQANSQHISYSVIFPPLTHLLTPWSRVLLEKLTGSQLGKIFSTFYGTQRFISAFSSARHLTLSAMSIQSMPHHPTSWRSTLILSSHLSESSKWFFPSGFPTKTLYASQLSLHMLNAVSTISTLFQVECDKNAQMYMESHPTVRKTFYWLYTSFPIYTMETLYTGKCL